MKQRLTVCSFNLVDHGLLDPKGPQANRQVQKSSRRVILTTREYTVLLQTVRADGVASGTRAQVNNLVHERRPRTHMACCRFRAQQLQLQLHVNFEFKFFIALKIRCVKFSWVSFNHENLAQRIINTRKFCTTKISTYTVCYRYMYCLFETLENLNTTFLCKH